MSDEVEQLPDFKSTAVTDFATRAGSAL